MNDVGSVAGSAMEVHLCCIVKMEIKSDSLECLGYVQMRPEFFLGSVPAGRVPSPGTAGQAPNCLWQDGKCIRFEYTGQLTDTLRTC